MKAGKEIFEPRIAPMMRKDEGSDPVVPPRHRRNPRLSNLSSLFILFFFLRSLYFDLRLREHIFFEFRKLKGSCRHYAFAALQSFQDLNITRVANSQRHAFL